MDKKILLSTLWIFLVVNFIFYDVFGLSIGQDRVYNSEKTFSIVPTEGWINCSEGNNIIFAQKLTSFRDRYQENIQIEAFPGINMTLDELWENYVIKDFPKSFENYKIKQTGKTNINGINAKSIEFTNTAHGQTFDNLVYILVEKNIMYQIICLAIEKDYKSVEREFKEMINTFKIGKDASR